MRSINEILDECEASKTVNAPQLLAAAREAIAALQWIADEQPTGAVALATATHALVGIKRILNQP